MTTARGIVEGLGGVWRGRSAMCRCPAHEDHTPSLSVSQTPDGRPLVHCFTGCAQAEVIAALRARGLWSGDAVADPAMPHRLSTPRDGLQRDDRERSLRARELFDRSQAIARTPVEAYLRGRGIRLPKWPADLRYYPNLMHALARKSFPAMIAALRDGRGEVVAIQRTYLERDGSGKAKVDGAKRTLGPMTNSAVRLFPVDRVLGLAEGVETALSAMRLYSLPVWATLSAHRLAAAFVPPSVRQVMIFADMGDVGVRKAFEAADLYESRGLHVEVITPAADFKGGFSDFNDVLTGHAA